MYCNPYYSLGTYSTPNLGASYEIQPLICGFQSELGIQEDSAKAPNHGEELDTEVDEFSDPHANAVPDDVKDEEEGNDYDDPYVDAKCRIGKVTSKATSVMVGCDARVNVGN
ncbi:hypothetical protein GOBAR_AA28922 [Gossypium barbadense]|uniref:Uncharacterized protein n=1 Tax=Gossypium barbadense TaxID=3634 RepID=A0A2P5WKZ8_GOSBA|nr:hypothetical protein GOBAR_AA28922 [Gossypium barbadense]